MNTVSVINNVLCVNEVTVGFHCVLVAFVFVHAIELCSSIAALMIGNLFA